VPYGHPLRGGSTVIQHIYDTHFDGVEEVARMRSCWATVAGFVDPPAGAGPGGGRAWRRYRRPRSGRQLHGFGGAHGRGLP
jgi:Glycosyl hydrolase family 67 C-terminus